MLEESVRLFNHSAVYWETVSVEEDETTLPTLEALPEVRELSLEAQRLWEMGSFAESLKFQECACLLIRDFLGLDDPGYASALDSFVARAHDASKQYLRRNRFEEAVDCVQRTFAITEKPAPTTPLPHDSLNSSLVLNASLPLEGGRSQLQRLAEVQRLLLRAIAWNNYGCLLRRTRDQAAAIAAFEQALSHFKLSQSSHSPVCSHLNLCALYSLQKQHAAAEQSAQCALELMRDEEDFLHGPFPEEYAPKPSERRNKAVLLASAYVHAGLEGSLLGKQELEASAAASILHAFRIAVTHLSFTSVLTKRCEDAFGEVVTQVRGIHLRSKSQLQALYDVIQAYLQLLTQCERRPLGKARTLQAIMACPVGRACPPSVHQLALALYPRLQLTTSNPPKSPGAGGGGGGGGGSTKGDISRKLQSKVIKPCNSPPDVQALHYQRAMEKSWSQRRTLPQKMRDDAEYVAAQLGGTRGAEEGGGGGEGGVSSPIAQPLSRLSRLEAASDRRRASSAENSPYAYASPIQSPTGSLSSSSRQLALGSRLWSDVRSPMGSATAAGSEETVWSVSDWMRGDAGEGNPRTPLSPSFQPLTSHRTATDLRASLEKMVVQLQAIGSQVEEADTVLQSF